jgi:hypothetical protein
MSCVLEGVKIAFSGGPLLYGATILSRVLVTIDGVSIGEQIY